LQNIDISIELCYIEEVVLALSWAEC